MKVTIKRITCAVCDELYARCLDKGVQIIATRTTSDDELVIYELGGTENDA